MHSELLEFLGEGGDAVGLFDVERGESRETEGASEEGASDDECLSQIGSGRKIALIMGAFCFVKQAPSRVNSVFTPSGAKRSTQAASPCTLSACNPRSKTRVSGSGESATSSYQ